MRVLFLSTSFAPPPIPSDKQFVADLLEHLPDGLEARVWTIGEIPSGDFDAIAGQQRIRVTNVNRVWHSPMSRSPGEAVPHPKHHSVRNLLELNLSIRAGLRGSLSRLIESYSPAVIHMTDNVGPITSAIRARFPDIYVTSAKPSARARSSAGYRGFIRICLKGVDRVIAYSAACADALVNCGIRRSTITTIPWGIKLPTWTPATELAEIRRRYAAANRLLAVALHRGSDEDLQATIGACKRIARTTPVTFVFAIRPPLFQTSYETWSEKDVHVVKGPSDFYALLEAADVALCHDENASTTTMPPLAWLEAMGRRTAILLKKVPGASDLIKDGVEGFLYDDVELLETPLAKLAANRSLLEKMQSHAGDRVVNSHDVRRIAACYGQLWRDLLEHDRMPRLVAP